MFALSENFQRCMKGGHVLHAKCSPTREKCKCLHLAMNLSAVFLHCSCFTWSVQKIQGNETLQQARINFVSENHASSAFTAFQQLIMTKTEKHRNHGNGERKLFWQLSLNPPTTKEGAERNCGILSYHKVVTCKTLMVTSF